MGIPPTTKLQRQRTILSNLQSKECSVTNHLLYFLFPIIFKIFGHQLMFANVTSCRRIITLITRARVVQRRLSNLKVTRILGRCRSIVLRCLFLFKNCLNSRGHVTSLRLLIKLFRYSIPCNQVSVNRAKGRNIILTLCIVSKSFTA